MKTGQPDELKTILKLFLANKIQKNKDDKEKEKECLAREAGPTKPMDMNPMMINELYDPTKVKLIKECFGPSPVCNNCESRGGSLKSKVECNR